MAQMLQSFVQCVGLMLDVSLFVCVCMQKYIIMCKKQRQRRTNCMLCDVSVPAMRTVGGPDPPQSIISIPVLAEDM